MVEIDIAALVAELEQARRAYYQDGNSQLSDEQFDAKEEQLRKLAAEHSYFQTVGSAVTAAAKLRHQVPMLSLSKLRNFDELEKWLQRLELTKLVQHNQSELIIQPKIDGLSASCYYRSGRLIYVVSRGDGRQGQNLSHIADYIDDIPTHIDTKADELEVRGELYLPKNSPFKARSLRNSCVGLVNRKEQRQDLRYVRFIAYQCARKRLAINEGEQICKLEQLGFHAVEFRLLRRQQAVEKYFQHYLDQLRDRWLYETDGLVLGLNDSSLFDRIDSHWLVTHHHHYSAALKPPSADAITTLQQLEWQLSRHGNLVPVACFKAVEINGVQIQRASAHNYRNVQRLDLRPGDRLKVARSNDVIPYILANLSQQKLYPIPKQCPHCAAILQWRDACCFCSASSCSPANIEQDPLTAPPLEQSAVRTGKLQLKQLDWQFSNTGQLSAQLQLEADAQSYTLKLEQWQQLDTLNLRQGDQISIASTNATIVLDNHSFTDGLPKNCPSCEQPLQNSSVHLLCSNKCCPEQLIQRCSYWVKQAEMEQVSEQTVRQLFATQRIQSVADLYRLQAKNLNNLEGFGAKKIDNLLVQIEKSRHLNVLEFLARLGIPLLELKSLQKLSVLLLLRRLILELFDKLIKTLAASNDNTTGNLNFTLSSNSHKKKIAPLSGLELQQYWQRIDRGTNLSELLEKNLQLATLLPSAGLLNKQQWLASWQLVLKDVNADYWGASSPLQPLLPLLENVWLSSPLTIANFGQWKSSCNAQLKLIKKNLVEIEIWNLLPLSAYLEVDPQLAADAALAASWVEWLSEPSNRNLLLELEQQLQLQQSAQQGVQQRQQILVALSGKGPMPRKELIDLLKQRGLAYSNSLTRQVKLLLCDELDGNSSKLKQAQNYGVKIISYSAFVGMDSYQLQQLLAER